MKGPGAAATEPCGFADPTGSEWDPWSLDAGGFGASGGRWENPEVARSGKTTFCFVRED